MMVSLDLPSLVARAPIVPGASLIDVSLGLYREQYFRLLAKDQEKVLETE
ncbi:MAG: hypothetical protein ACJ788_18075 [Ktedonobacteraceae bacterium]